MYFLFQEKRQSIDITEETYASEHNELSLAPTGAVAPGLAPTGAVAADAFSMCIDRLFDCLGLGRWAESCDLQVCGSLQMITVEAPQHPCATIERIGVLSVISRHQHEAGL